MPDYTVIEDGPLTEPPVMLKAGLLRSGGSTLEIVETNISLDIYNYDTTPSTVKAIALDSNTRYVAAALQNANEVYDLPSSATVELYVRRPDNTGVQVTGSTYVYEGDGGTQVYGAYAELTQLAIAKKGACAAQFKITVGSQILHTEIFAISVGQALDADIEEWAGDLDGHNLDDMAEQIETLETNVGVLQENVTEIESDIEHLETNTGVMQDDISESKTDIETIFDTAYLTDKAFGSVVCFEDGVDNVPMKSVKVNITPVQSGTGDPSPSNVRPISGFDTVNITRTGKNLLNCPTTGGRTNSGITWTYNSDGSVSATGTATNNSWSYSNPATVTLPKGVYTVSVASPFGMVVQNLTDDEYIHNGAYSRVTFILDKQTLIGVHARVANGTTIDATTGIQIEVGADTTEFEPYRGNTYDISLSSAGTVYSGTLDVTTGELIVDKASVVMDGSSDEGWYVMTTANIFRANAFYPKPASGASVSDFAAHPILSSCTNTNRYNYAEMKAAYPSVSFSGEGRLYLAISADVTTIEQALAWLAINKPQLVYYLAEPITYYLAPTEIKSLLGINNIWSDAGEIEAECRIDAKLRTGKLQHIAESSYVIDSAVGYFADGADNVPMKSVKVTIEPVQSGTGDSSPSNVRPINGWDTIALTRTGKNILIPYVREFSASGITARANNDGSVTLNGTSTGVGGISLFQFPDTRNLNAGTYYVRLFGENLTGLNMQLYVDGSSKFTNQSGSFTIQDDGLNNYIRVRWAGGATFDNVTVYPMLIVGTEEPSIYEPCQGNTYKFSLSSAGTVYGGTLDVTKGELIVDRAIFVLNGTDRVITGTNTTQGTRYFVAGTRNEAVNTDAEHPVYSDKFLGNLALTNPGRVYITGTAHNTLVFVLTDQTIATVDAANAWFAANPTQICYPLATPITYQLTPTEIKSLLGINNIWSDAGDVEVEYRADTKLYIDKKLASS